MENSKIRWHIDFSLSFLVATHSLCPFLLLTAFCYMKEWKNKTLERSKRREYRTKSRNSSLQFFCLHLFSPLASVFPLPKLYNEAKEDVSELRRQKEEITKEVKLTLPQNEKCDPSNNDGTPWMLKGISHIAKAVFGLRTFYSYSPSIGERVNNSWPFQMWGKRSEY